MLRAPSRIDASAPRIRRAGCATLTSNLKLHLPLLKVVVSVALAYLSVLCVQWRLNGEISLSRVSLAWLLAGGLYTHLFEYAYHSCLMHRKFRIGNRHWYDRRHLDHHRLFGGENFQTRQPAHLQEVATHWYTLPALFYLHYLAFLALFPVRHAPWFFLGVALQALAYESTHWFTHVKDNSFDRILAAVPILSRLRAAQIEHHRKHHATPTTNFNFTPPYLADRCCGTYRQD